MARRTRQWTPNVVRERIRVSMLRHRLENHVLGRIEMSPTQVRAAEILLRKCLPDLNAVEHSGVVTQRPASEIPDAELTDIATGSRDRASEETGSETDGSGVHPIH